jgi:hypothetical protein
VLQETVLSGDSEATLQSVDMPTAHFYFLIQKKMK